MPIMIVTVPPQIELLPPDAPAGTKEIVSFTKFVVKYVLEMPSWRNSYTSIKMAFSIERSLNALADIDLGGTWELGKEEHDAIIACLDKPEYMQLAIGPDGQARAVVTPGFAFLPWATRQILPFLEAIKSAKEKT